MSGHATPPAGSRVVAGLRWVMLVFFGTAGCWRSKEMAQKGQWVWAPKKPRPISPEPAEKQAIITACEALINNVLKPRYLPEIRPTEHNYPIDIHGDWRAGRYRFMARFRSGFPDNTGEEFDAPFARIDRMGPDRFDIYWMRHTGTWWHLHTGKTLAEALDIIASDGVLRPPI
jgi:hypothetical protein